ncbi:MAG: ribonuclease Y [Patescibacteria group bacterium]
MFNILKTIFKPKKRQVSEKRHVPVQPTVRKQPSVVVKVQEKVQEEAQLALTRANEEVAKMKQEAQKALRKAAESTAELEKRIMHREQQLSDKEKGITQEKERVDSVKKEIEKTRETMLQKLETISGMTKDQAKQFLLNAWEDKMKAEIAKRIKSAEEEVKSRSEEKAKEILVEAMKHGATDYVSEFTLSTISLPSDDFKGRIIGKDGRNIRAFELATGVDVDLEEEGVIRISSFDAVKREIARISLEKLIKDGRIQPQRIEEIINTTKSELDKIMFKAGEELAHKVGIYNLPQDVTALLGRFKYRYSYGQNMILHTLEETKIGIALAHELKADVNVVKLGCLLHDIGKVISDKEGSHVDLGVEFLKKHRFPQKVVDCVAAHHEDIPFPSIEAVIVYISDAVSGGRPGARHEDFEQYLKRIKTIEDIAKTKKGVRDVYALQAGRELRVIVKPDEIADDEMTVLAEKIREELEKKFDVFPGQIKVTIIRESRAEAVTKI